MNTASMICFVIYFIVALLLIGIGISQYRSKTPVAFYSGEKPFDEKELSDVPAWNKRHGMMWISYGAMVMISYAAGAGTGSDLAWLVIPPLGGIIAMIWYHHRLIRIYRR